VKIARNLLKPVPLLMVALLLGLNSASWAGVTGKIAGVVTDSLTGEPVVNANIVLVGTDFGAATSLDGDYFIINVPPGKYSVTASFVGYVSKTQEDVLVYADYTTTLDFNLVATVIEGQEVVVKAKRKVLRHDVTATTRMTTGDEIYNMPVADFVGALGTVAGAVGSGNNIHIRGGRRGEVSYLVDGMEVKDPLYNTRMMRVGSPAVAEMITMTGGFDAEFGNAQSAVINIVTREGGKEYHGKVKYLFDDLSPKNDELFETRTTHLYHEYDDPERQPFDETFTTRYQPKSHYQNYDYLEGSLGGPEPLTYYLLPRLGLKIPGYMTIFIAGDISGRNTSSMGNYIGSSPDMKHDASGFLGFDSGRLNARREQTFLNGSAQLTYNINPTMKLKFGYRTTNNWVNPFYFRLNRNFPFDYTEEERNQILRDWVSSESGRSTEGETFVFGQDDDGDGKIDEEALNGKDDDLDGVIDEDVQWYQYNASDHTRLSHIDDEQMLLSWSHAINKKTYYHLKLSRYKASREWKAAGKDETMYGEVEEPFTDLPGADGKYNSQYDPGEPFEDLDGDGVWDMGNPANGYRHWRGFYYTGDGLGGDNGQLVPAHLEEESYVWAMKFQMTSQMHRNHQLRGGLDLNYFDLHSYFPEYPSIDNEGWGIYSTEYHVYPSDGAAYMQDKMEYKDITLTLGGRVDFFMPGDQVRHVIATDSSSAQWTSNHIPFEVPDKIKTFVSPRLGVSFAVTEKAYLHGHYGHFYQRPRWDDMFDMVNTEVSGGTPLVGNPDLDPEKTVAYEIGIAWNPYADYLVDVTGYLKDIKNWINTTDGKIWFMDKYPQWASSVRNFAMWDNQDYAFARGLEFTLSKEYGTNFSGRVSYTLSWVNAKNSYSNGTQVIRNDYVEPPLALPAGWDRRHSIVANLGLNYGPREPVFGIKGAPGDWAFNTIITVESGLPYTPTDASGTRIEGREMSERTPWTYNTNLNLAKFFTFGRWRTSLWIEVRNLFDTENVDQVDDNYGRAGRPNAFDDLTGEPGWVNDSASPNYVLNPVAGPNPDAWRNPRFIRIGLGLEF